MAVKRTMQHQQHIQTGHHRAGATTYASTLAAGRGQNPHAPLPTSTLQVIYQNVHGWENKANLLRRTFSTLNADVILLADTGLKNNNKLKFHPYISYQHSSTGGFHAGVGIFIKKSIQHSLVKRKFSHDTIAVYIETTTGPIILATNYHPPSRNYLPQEDLDWLANHQTPAYLLADLNAHHQSFPHNSGENAKGRVLVNVWINRGRFHRIGPDFHTVHQTGSQGTTPDIVLLNKHVYHNHFITPLRSNPSDHLPIKLTISTKPIVKNIKCENIDAADWKQYNQFLKSTAGTVNLRQATQQEVCAAIADKIDSIQEARKRYIPQRRICTRPFIPVSPKFKRLTSVLCRLRDLHSNTRDPTTHINITKQRKKTIQLLREEGARLTKEHWQDIVYKASKLHAKDPSKYWKKINKLKGRPAQRIGITRDFTRNSPLINSPAEQVDVMTNEWSARIGPPPPISIHPDTEEELNNFSYDLCTPYPTADFTRLDPACQYTNPITPREVYNTIASFKHKAPGEDGINKMHLTHLPKIFIVQLAHIFTAALSIGYFPDNLKSAIMIFIPKPNKPKCHPGSYRPISLLPTIAKIYGKILAGRLSTFIEVHGYNHPHQYGFTKNRGTISSLAMTYENIARQLAGTYRPRISIVLRDIKSAFDRLDHRRIKYHLDRIKLPPPLCKALSSFLDDRTAKIRIGKTLGEPFALLGGVPQGAGPSAHLFNLVISKSPIGVNDRHQYSGYADDCSQTVATPTSRNISATTEKHGRDLIRAIKLQNDFEHREGLMTDPAKSWIIPINQMIYPEIIVNGQEYKQPDRPVQLLGLTITKTSFICKHIPKQVAKAKLALGNIRRFHSLPIKLKLGLVKSLVLTHLFYPPIPLHLASKHLMLKLQAVQNQALRWVYNIKWDDFIANKRIHKKYNIRTVNQELYWRAKSTWDKIRNNNAADEATVKKLEDMDYHSNKQHSYFRSSIEATENPEPPPLYGR